MLETRLVKFHYDETIFIQENNFEKYHMLNASHLVLASLWYVIAMMDQSERNSIRVAPLFLHLIK